MVVTKRLRVTIVEFTIKVKEREGARSVVGDLPPPPVGDRIGLTNRYLPAPVDDE